MVKYTKAAFWSRATRRGRSKFREVAEGSQSARDRGRAVRLLEQAVCLLERAAREKTVWAGVYALLLALLPVLLAGWLSTRSASHIFMAAEQASLRRTFDEVSSDYSIGAKAAWLDIVERGYPRRGAKSANQVDWETKGYARFGFLKSLLENQCRESAEMQDRVTELECANYRVYALYDATEEGASSVKSEAKKQRRRYRDMSRCSGFDALMAIETSRSRRNVKRLTKHFDREYLALLTAIGQTREALRTSCQPPATGLLTKLGL